MSGLTIRDPPRSAAASPGPSGAVRSDKGSIGGGGRPVWKGCYRRQSLRRLPEIEGRDQICAAWMGSVRSCKKGRTQKHRATGDAQTRKFVLRDRRGAFRELEPVVDLAEPGTFDRDEDVGSLEVILHDAAARTVVRCAELWRAGAFAGGK